MRGTTLDYTAPPRYTDLGLTLINMERPAADDAVQVDVAYTIQLTSGTKKEQLKLYICHE